MWNVLTKPGNPTILMALEEAVPGGYTIEAQTSNPDYLTTIVIDYGRKVTVLAFRNRFTKAEKIKIEMASLDNPALAVDNPMRLLAASLRVDLKDTENATFIDLDRLDTRAGVQALETYGIIAVGRAIEILDSPVAISEMYRE